MKPKKSITILILISLLCLGAYWFTLKASPVRDALQKEWLENQFPEKLDENTLLPYGYTLGPWPSLFEGEPIVTKLTYQKGPPQKFLEKIIQIWRPVEIELQIYGPHTLKTEMGVREWKSCFEHSLNCRSEKKLYLEEVFPEAPRLKAKSVTLTWFDSLDPLGARGTHLKIEMETYRIDRYTLITENGALQTFSLKTVKGPLGELARDQLIKILSSLKVKEDLGSARAWIQNKIKTVNLDQLKVIKDPRERFLRLIQTQNWIYSLLTVDPTHVEPFYHLAGVTHLLAIELIKSNKTYFNSQEAWISSFKPLFETLLAYTKDFPGNESLSKNLEALLQDILFEQNKLRQ